MRRLMSLGAIIVVLLALTAAPQVVAQDATPAVVEPIVTGDFTFPQFADFGVLDAATLPSAPATVTLFRLEFAPGASVAFPPGDPGLGLHLVESGTLTVGHFSADITITRAANPATPDAQGTSEILPAGEETQIGPGDGFLWPPYAGGENRNEGTEPVVLSVVNVYPAVDQPASDTGVATPAA